MNNILEILLGIVFILHQIPGGDSKEISQLSIDEKGTLFNETIEIDEVEKTVVYKVPSHNKIEKSVVLVDYKNGHFVTRIPEREACYIKAFPTADEQSITQTMQNLKLIQRIKAKGNPAVPIETQYTIMKIIREIPREELRLKVAEFCGNNSAYEVEERPMPPKRGGRAVAKRTSPPITRTYSMTYAVRGDASELKNQLPNGYLTCKSVENHNKIIVDCLTKGKKVRVGCGRFPKHCRYLAFCDVPLLSMKDIRNAQVHYVFSGRTRLQYITVDIKCVEQHKFTIQWCCDVIPC